MYRDRGAIKPKVGNQDHDDISEESESFLEIKKNPAKIVNVNDSPPYFANKQYTSRPKNPIIPLNLGADKSEADQSKRSNSVKTVTKTQKRENRKKRESHRHKADKVEKKKSRRNSPLDRLSPFTNQTDSAEKHKEIHDLSLSPSEVHDPFAKRPKLDKKSDQIQFYKKVVNAQ